MSGKRIFIVENERIVALDLQHRLERLGHKVVGSTASAREALKNIKSSSAELALVDIRLDEKIDGIKLAEILYKRYLLPVIFITAYSDKATLERVKASNACGFIIKPFSDEELTATIDIGLHEHELELKLRQSEEQYRHLFNEAPVGYHEIDLKGNLIRVNRTELDMLGYDADEMMGRPVWEFVREKDDVRTIVIEKLKMDEFSPRPFERNYLCGDGRLLPVLVQDYPIRNNHGRLTGVRSTLQDISLLKEEQAKHASFYDIVEKSLVGIVVADQKGLVLYANPATERILNCKRERLVGREFMVPVSKVLSEIDMSLSNGGRGTAEVLITPGIWEEKPAYLISVYDITERKKVEAELRQLDQMKTDFISTVSHELRTPLSITKEGLSLVLDRVAGDINEKQQLILAAAKNNIDRLARIINELLDVSRIESGKIQLQRKILNMVEIVKQAAASFAPLAEEKKLELITDFSAEKIELYADRDKIIQIFTNLINNAIKFTEQGAIRISLRDLGKAVKCVIADTGMGIAKSNMPKLFDKFQQFGRVDGPGDKGTGLGLSIVKGLVDLHSGKISVESKRRCGTKFIIVFPKKQ